MRAEGLREVVQRVLNFYQSLSSRDKALVWVAIVLLLVVLISLPSNSTQIRDYAEVATILAFTIALVSFLWEFRANREERAFSVFLRFIDAYEQLQEDRRQRWNSLKEVVRANPNTQHEIGDRTNSVDYLLLRIEQDEPLYAVEHSLLENEIKSLNLLNELCRYSLKDTQKMLLTKALLADEISFYQNNLQRLLAIRDRESVERLFSIPRYDALIATPVEDFFNPPLS